MKIEEINLLKSKLPKGYREALSIITGKSVSTIDVVLAGKRKGASILKEAVRLAKNHQRELKEIEQSIKNL